MQMYRAEISINLDGSNEYATVIVCASSAEAAGVAACVHMQISPTLARVEVFRIKGNCFVSDNKTVVNDYASPMQGAVDVYSDGSHKFIDERLRDAHEVQTSTDNRPKLTKRVIELRATIFSRTDDAACVGVGKALINRGKSGKWASDYCELEDLKVLEDEDRKPKQTRMEMNASYSSTKVYRS